MLRKYNLDLYDEWNKVLIPHKAGIQKSIMNGCLRILETLTRYHWEILINLLSYSMK